MLEERIIERSNKFIYIYENEKRKALVEKMTNKYPVIVDRKRPMCVCINEVGLPQKISLDKIDKVKIVFFAKEYLSFLLAYNLLRAVKEQVGFETFSINRASNFLRYLNSLIDTNSFQISTLEELLSNIEKSKNSYLENYLKFIQTGNVDIFFNDLKIKFMDIFGFVKNLKMLLKNPSYFCIVFVYKQKDEVINYSIRAINSLIGIKNNFDFCINVVCTPGKWKEYLDINKYVLMYRKDYDVIEIDSSLKNYVDELKNKNC